jgi:hypothetical protein
MYMCSMLVARIVRGVRLLRTGEGRDEDGGGGAEGGKVGVSQRVEKGECRGWEAGDEDLQKEEVVGQIAAVECRRARGGQLRARGWGWGG